MQSSSVLHALQIQPFYITEFETVSALARLSALVHFITLRWPALPLVWCVGNCGRFLFQHYHRNASSIQSASMLMQAVHHAVVKLYLKVSVKLQ